MQLIKIFIVEDDPIYKEFLIKELGKQRFMKVVGSAENGGDLLKQIKKTKPNVILLDVIMPNTDIIKTICKIKEIDPDIHILIHSQYLSDAIIISLHKAGCCGYVEKIHFETLVSAIISMVKDRHYYPDNILNVILQYQSGQAKYKLPKGFESISKMDVEFLELFCKKYSYKKIADLLNRSKNTVRGYKYNIKAKLGIETDEELHKLFQKWKDS